LSLSADALLLPETGNCNIAEGQDEGLLERRNIEGLSGGDTDHHDLLHQDRCCIDMKGETSATVRRAPGAGEASSLFGVSYRSE